MICIYVLIIYEGNCENCVASSDREMLLESRYVRFVMGYSTVLMLFFPDITDQVIKTMINDSAQMSNSPYRDVYELTTLRDWDGVADLLVYGAPMPKSNKKQSIQCYVHILGSKQEPRKMYNKHNLNASRAQRQKKSILPQWMIKETMYTNGKLFNTVGFYQCKQMFCSQTPDNIEKTKQNSMVLFSPKKLKQNSTLSLISFFINLFILQLYIQI